MDKKRYINKEPDHLNKAANATEDISHNALSRYDLDSITFNLLLKDYIRFTQSYPSKLKGENFFPNNFISNIITNYLSYMQDNDVESLENSISDLLSTNGIIDFVAQGRLSINKSLYLKLTEFDFIYDSNFKKRTVFNYILRNYAQLNLSTREIIFSYQNYKCIVEAVENQQTLNITINSRIYEYKPYCLSVDDNSSSIYLVGYSREKRSDEDFSVYPVKLSRIESCRNTHKEADISYKEKQSIEKLISRFGIAYSKVTDKTNLEKIKIRLTEHGYYQLYLKYINHQRPVPIKAPEGITINDETFFDLIFDCSQRQIINYFFNFGKDAMVLEPLDLREYFVNKYKDAFDLYRHT